MSIQTVFPLITNRLRHLRETVSAARLTVVEDKPIRGDLALIDLRADATDDLIGRIDEAAESAARGDHALRPPERREIARLAMEECQMAFSHLSRRFRSDLVSYERMAELIGVARERGREWHAWAASVQGALRQCEQPLMDLEDALFGGWQELSVQTGTSISVRTSSIGQRVTTTV